MKTNIKKVIFALALLIVGMTLTVIAVGWLGFFGIFFMLWALKSEVIMELKGQL